MSCGTHATVSASRVLDAECVLCCLVQSPQFRAEVNSSYHASHRDRQTEVTEQPQHLVVEMVDSKQSTLFMKAFRGLKLGWARMGSRDMQQMVTTKSGQLLTQSRPEFWPCVR